MLGLSWALLLAVLPQIAAEIPLEVFSMNHASELNAFRIGSGRGA